MFVTKVRILKVSLDPQGSNLEWTFRRHGSREERVDCPSFPFEVERHNQLTPGPPMVLNPCCPVPQHNTHDPEVTQSLLSLLTEKRILEELSVWTQLDGVCDRNEGLESSHSMCPHTERSLTPQWNAEGPWEGKYKYRITPTSTVSSETISNPTQTMGLKGVFEKTPDFPHEFEWISCVYLCVRTSSTELPLVP